MTDSVSSTCGVHSEVGRLHKVLVCRPGLAHRRLTPTNSDDLLFDDVLWVENAQRDPTRSTITIGGGGTGLRGPSELSTLARHITG
jgi:hypothetical protein